MQKENKRKVLFLVIGILVLLLACIGATYAYFTARVSGEGNNKVDMSTVVLASANMDYGDKIEANGIYPGNKIIKTLHVTGSGPENAKPITATIILTPNVVDFPNHVKYTVYAVEKSEINTNDICEPSKPTVEDGKYYDAMECDTSSLGDPILEGIFEGRKTITKEIEVTSTTDTTYYLLVEYINDPNEQNEEQGKTFTINLGFQATYEGPSMKYIFKLDDEEVANIPEKESDYVVEVACDDGVERIWNQETWSLEVEEKLEYDTTCTISFKKDPIESAMAKGELVYDGTTDNNLRYAGANPNNYVSFNGELWRIIGWMNNIEDENGSKETRMKIIRSESIGNYAWASSGKNNWAIASLQTYLNGDYYNNLTEEAQNMIGNSVWYLGGFSVNNSSASGWYKIEKGVVVNSSYPTTWLGKIALMYPSDYGFAVGGSVKNTCLSSNTVDYDKNSCFTYDWLYNGTPQLTLTPAGVNTVNVIKINTKISTGQSSATASNTRPSLYLNSNIVITSGKGTSEDPFILSAS